MPSWYTKVFSALAGQKVRSKPVVDEFTLIQAAFAALPTPAQMYGANENYAAATGAANTYAITVNAYVTAYVDGMCFRFKANAANTGAATFNVNAIGAKSLVRPAGAVLQSGDIASGQLVEVFYDATGDRFQMATLVSGAAAPANTYSGTAGGVIDLLTGANIASASTINLTSATGNLVHVTGTATITAVTLAKGPRTVVFDDALTLTHHATNNNLPGGSNITTAAGDRATYWSDGTTVYCIDYAKANGAPLVVATQAQMEAASANTVPVTPGTANWHPGVAKAWLQCNAAGTVDVSHNITSITDNGAGNLTVTIATDFSSANYVVIVGTEGGNARSGYAASKTAGTVECYARDVADAPTDPTKWHIAFFGDQA